MPGGNRKGPGGQRRGIESGQGTGRKGVPYAAGPGGNYVCKQCGYKEPHDVGEPCNQKKCPTCGAIFTRE